MSETKDPKDNDKLAAKAAPARRKLSLKRGTAAKTLRVGSKQVEIAVVQQKRSYSKQDMERRAQEQAEAAKELALKQQAELLQRQQREAEAAKQAALKETTASTADDIVVAKAAEKSSVKTRAKAPDSAAETAKVFTKPAAVGADSEADKKKKRSALAASAGKEKFSIDRYLVSSADAGDFNKGVRRRKRKFTAAGVSKKIAQGFVKPTDSKQLSVDIPEAIAVGELARRMSVKAAAVIKVLMGMGTMATINQSLDQDTAVLVVEEMGYPYKLRSHDEIEQTTLAEQSAAVGEALPRPPVVTIMGHVDHGKTSLLDYIRRTHVTSAEAGGITQHIGAYHVQAENGVVTFLDTPGHAAFTAMRARGAKCTDIVVLVVAADDGVMPQTIEAIQHAQAAKVPIIVAINKIDKPEADLERIRSELSQHGVVSEEWGGEFIFQSVSAKTGKGVEDLLSSILLQAEVLELAAPNQGPAQGVVIESRLDKNRGPVATVLVTSGELNKGDIILAGAEFGRVRSMMDDAGQSTRSATPSIPVEILGLSGVPAAGQTVQVVETERKARELAMFRATKSRQEHFAKQHAVKLDNLFSDMSKGQVKALNVILKADVQGSLEAIIDGLNKLSTDEVKVSIVASGVGGISESDVHLATVSQAIIVGFNVRADSGAKQLAAQEDIELRYYSIIYSLLDEVKGALSGMLEPEVVENIVGLASVRDVFRSSRLGAIAGCLVVEGRIKRNLPIRVLRDNVVIYEGQLESLRRFKDDVNEVQHGTECGIGVKDYNDIKNGDQIEVYEKIVKQRTLD